MLNKIKKTFHAYPIFRALKFELDDEGKLTIFGNVKSFHAKQTAQEIAMKIEGVSQVVNYLKVLS